MRELAVEAGVTASTATRILDALERRGIIMRTRSAEDRRAVTVTLTDFGRSARGSQGRVAARGASARSTRRCRTSSESWRRIC